MSTTKVYAVLLENGSASELGMLVEPYVKGSQFGEYIYAKKIEPNGPYFHMWINHTHPRDTLTEIELQIPHRHIKAIFYAADIKEVGFI
jgi:hypothetical protein